MSFSQSLLGGLKFAQAMKDIYNDRQLRSGLEEIGNEKVEEVKTQRAATAAEKAKLVDPDTEQNRMLAEQQAEFGAYQPEAYVPEDPQVTGVSGYKYRDQITPYRPDAGLMRADQAMRRADVHEKYGADPERAAFLRRGAEQDRANAIEQLTAEAFKSGSLDKLNEAYSQVNDGVSSGVERGPDGTVSIYTWPDNDPAKRSLLMSSPSERDALAQLQRQIDPNTFLQLANAEQNLQQGQLGMENTRQLMGERGLDRQDADYRRQYQAADDQLKYAIASRDEGEIRSAYAEWDAVRRSGLAGGGTPAGLRGGGGGGGFGSSVSGYEPMVEAALQATNSPLPAQYVLSVINAESSGNPTAVSPKGASGVMQLMPGTAKRFGVEDPTKPDQAIVGGVKYLNWLYNRYGGDLTKTTAAYNAGEGKVDRYGGVPPYAETQAYVKKVLGGLRSSGDLGTASAAPSGPSSGGLAKGLARIGLKPSAPKLASFDPAKVYSDSEEWAMANKPDGATPSDVAAMAKQRYREIEALYSERMRGQAQENPEDAAAARVAKAKADAATKTAGGARAVAKEGALKRQEAEGAKQGQQEALAALNKATQDYGWVISSNIASTPAGAKRAAEHVAAIAAAYESLSDAGKKQADAKLAKLYDLYPDLE
jgi:Transglycosylase SLT domain